MFQIMRSLRILDQILLAEGYWGITVHFLFHGCHHKYPLDATRLVFPPVPAAAVAGGISAVLQLLMSPVPPQSNLN